MTTDASSLHSTATSKRPLLADDEGDDEGSLAPSAAAADGKKASVHTADTVGAGHGPSGSDPAADGLDDGGPLRAFASPIGLFSRYVTKKEVVLEIEEAASSIKGRDSLVRDLSHGGKNVFIRYAKPMHLFAAKEYRDALTEEPILTVALTWDAVLFRIKLAGEDAKTREKLFKATSKCSLRKAEMKATFKNLAGGRAEEIELLISGDWAGRKGARIEVRETGQVLAVISRQGKWKLLDYLAASGKFLIRVAPGVDLALVVGLCQAFDEKRFYG